MMHRVAIPPSIDKIVKASNVAIDTDKMMMKKDRNKNMELAKEKLDHMIWIEF